MPLRSTLTATTSNLSEPNSCWRRSRAGISLRQGRHQVAHRLRSTTLPRQSASVRSLPSPSWNLISGSASGSLRKTKAAMWPWLNGLVTGPLGSTRAAGGGGSAGVLAGGAALSGRPTVTYTAANPTRAAMAAVAREPTAVRDGLCLGAPVAMRVALPPLQLEIGTP